MWKGKSLCLVENDVFYLDWVPVYIYAFTHIYPIYCSLYKLK